MAYAYDPNLDKKKNELDPNQQLTGASEVMGGTAPQAQGETPQENGAARGPTSSDRFQNLNSYLDANSGQGFGEKFAGKVGSSIDSANQAQESSDKAFRSKVDESTVTADPNLISQASTDPTKFVQDKSNVDAFTKARDAEYKGPRSFQDAQDVYGQALGATQNAKDQADASKSEGGRFALLDNYFSRPSYNHGQKTLDNLLVQNDPNTQQALKNEQARADQANQKFQGMSGQLSDYASQGVGKTETTRKSARDSIGLGSDGQFTSDGLYSKQWGALDSKAADVASQKDKQRLSLIGKPLDLNRRGTPEYYGVDPDKFLSWTDPTRLNIEDPETRAKIGALEQLAGRPGTAFSTDVAGYNFDKDSFKAASGKAMGDYNSKVSNIINQSLPSVTVPSTGVNPSLTPIGVQKELSDTQKRIALAKLNEEYGQANDSNFNLIDFVPPRKKGGVGVVPW